MSSLRLHIRIRPHMMASAQALLLRVRVVDHFLCGRTSDGTAILVIRIRVYPAKSDDSFAHSWVMVHVVSNQIFPRHYLNPLRGFMTRI